ncbi:MAG TPA: metallophosphoesterase [Actinomycetota bacterium]|nr:metallophosphoesterase [Actinomycetota bacterium]
MIRRPKARANRRRLLFVTDLHGSDLTFRKLLKALEVWRPDAVIAGGDVAGKAMVPVVDLGDKFRLKWMGQVHEFASRELSTFLEKVGQVGFYWHIAPVEEIEAMRDDPVRTNRIFEEVIARRWSAWLERLEDRCRQLRVPAYVMAGNDDPWSLDAVTLVQREWVTPADGAVVPVLDHWMLVSCGLGNPTPWQCPRDVSESELADKLRSITEGLKDFSNVIANIHPPPFDSTLDLAPKLDTSVSPPRPVPGEIAPVGSTAVRDFLADAQPLLSLHGHIHESRAAVRLGRTWAVNPGSEYAEGVLRAALVTVEPSRVVSHQLVAA